MINELAIGPISSPNYNNISSPLYKPSPQNDINEKNMQNLEAESMYNPASPAYANQNSYLYNNNLK